METYTEIFTGYALTLQMFFLSVSECLQTVANDAIRKATSNLKKASHRAVKIKQQRPTDCTWDRKLSDTAETKHTAQLWSMRLPSASTLLVIQFPHPETPPTNCFLLSHQPLPAPFTLQSTVRHIIKSSLQDKIIQPLFSTVYALWPYHNYVIYHSKLHLCVYLLSLLVIVTSG